MTHFKKGMEVHIRNHQGQADTRDRYKIRSCGKKQAIVDYIVPEGSNNGYFRGTGSTYYLQNITTVRAMYDNDNEIPNYVKTSWSDHFVLAGADGWDACEN